MAKKLQEEVRKILFTYFLPDSLKPQYDGMTAWEIAGKILDKVNEFGGIYPNESAINDHGD